MKKASSVLFVIFLILSGSVAMAAISSTGESVAEIPAPASVEVHNLESNSEIRLFNEVSGYTLQADMVVDISAPGFYDEFADLTPLTIGAGTTVDSYFLHFDPIALNWVRLRGSVTFDQDVVGIIVRDPKLKDSNNILGASGTNYGSWEYREYELNGSDDSITLSSDRRTVTVETYGGPAVDQLRVITSGEPKTTIWQIGTFDGNVGPENGSREFLSNSDFIDTYNYNVDLNPDDEVLAPSLPGYLDYQSSAPNSPRSAAREINIEFNLDQTYEDSHLVFSRYGSENNDILLDGSLIATTIGPGEYINRSYVIDLGTLGFGSHTISLRYAGGGVDSGNYIDALQLSGISFMRILNVPLFKQGIEPFNDGQPYWEDHIYNDADFQTLYCGTSIAQCGCAVTSAAMTLRYYGVTHAPIPSPIALQTDPATVNNYFQQGPVRNVDCNLDPNVFEPGLATRGYFCGGVNWYAVSDYSKDAFDTYGTQMLAFNGYESWSPETLREDIEFDNPVILRVPGPQHWVVATGTVDDTFTINDPLYNRTHLNDPAYGNRALSMVHYVRTASDFSAIVVGVVSPAQVLVTDASGNRTGFDFDSSTIVTEIPDSTYFFDPAIADDTGQRQPPPEGLGNYWIIVPTPQAGLFELEVIAPQDLTYAMAVYAYDRGSALSLNAFEGITPLGTQDVYKFSYNPTPGAKTIALQVPIDIKPGSDPNCFNSNGHGAIPVAILSSPTFDATTVDPATISLDGQGVRVVGKGNTQAHIDDVDNDGIDDLVVQIEDADGTYDVGDGIAVVTGETFDGLQIKGEDSICIVP